MSNTGIYEEDYEDGSDAGSLYADSPSDGYFSQREHPQETFVEQSSILAESEAKAREAAESRVHSSPAALPSRTSTTSPSRSPVWTDESTALLDAGPAPPDYAAATANRPRTQQSSDHASSPSENVPARPVNYGAIGQTAQDTRSAPPQNTQSAPPQADAQWPFGNRGSPFGGDNAWPLGNRGNPFAGGFPPGPGGNVSAFRGDRDPPGSRAQPQSMRDGAATTDPEANNDGDGGNAWKRGKHSKKPRWRRVARRCKSISALNFLLAILVVGLIVILARVTRGTSENGLPSAGDGEEKIPVEDGGDDEDGHHQAPPNSTAPTHPSNSKCAFTTFSESLSFGFDDPGNFSFTEQMEPATFMSGGISGNIFILPAPQDQEEAVRVWVSFATTEPWHVTQMYWDYTDDSLALKFPKLEKSHQQYAKRACMDVAVGIYVRRDAVLGDFAIDTASLNVEAGEGLFGRQIVDHVPSHGLWLANTTTIHTKKGHVKMAYWASRETIIDATSGSVHGTYALRDLLSVRTSSGSIGIKVLPQVADATNPAPAECTVLSTSGSVHVGFPVDGLDIPARDYRTRIESKSSSISGSYIHGSSTSFLTHSGSMNVDVLPYLTSSNNGKTYDPSTLRTESGSGSTGLCILSPITHNTAPLSSSSDWPGYEDSLTETLNTLHSSHKSVSGSLKLTYPQEWSGTIEGWTSSGSINVKGKDVHTYVAGDVGRVGRHVVARKGYGSSKLEFRTGSGSVGVKVGEY